MNLLHWLILFPFICSLSFFLLPRTFSAITAKRVAFILSLFPLFLLVYYGFNGWIGKSISREFFPFLSIQWHFTVDRLSLFFLFLTIGITSLSIASISGNEKSNTVYFYALLFLLEGLLIGFFTARDLALFTFFWESMLIPVYFIIALWGGENRSGAAFKFLIYSIAGSTFMIAAILALYFASGTFNMDLLQNIGMKIPHAGLLFIIFALAFSVKTPLFPFHGWLSDAYTEAPVVGTIVLSSVLSKAGIYGFLRIGPEIFPDVFQEWSKWLLVLAVIGIFYGGFAAWMENNYKRLLAYASFSHVNFILAGVFALQITSQEGAIVQSIAHALSIAGLFLVAGWIESRIGSTSMKEQGGLAGYFPYLCWLSLFFIMASIALPGTGNFIGEFFILFGLYSYHPWIAVTVAMSLILSAIYSLRWMQKLYFGGTTGRNMEKNDIGLHEFLIALPLGALLLWIGLYPGPILKEAESAITTKESL